MSTNLGSYNNGETKETKSKAARLREIEAMDLWHRIIFGSVENKNENAGFTPFLMTRAFDRRNDVLKFQTIEDALAGLKKDFDKVIKYHTELGENLVYGDIAEDGKSAWLMSNIASYFWAIHEIKM